MGKLDPDANANPVTHPDADAFSERDAVTERIGDRLADASGRADLCFPDAVRISLAFTRGQRYSNTLAFLASDDFSARLSHPESVTSSRAARRFEMRWLLEGRNYSPGGRP